MSRAQLLQRLGELQKTPRFEKKDIRTISAILSTEALAKHVEVCEQAAGR